MRKRWALGGLLVAGAFGSSGFSAAPPESGSAPFAVKVDDKPAAQPGKDTAQEKKDKTASKAPKVAKPPLAKDLVQPESVEQLKELQGRVKVVVEKCQPCTVGIFIGSSAGSGVFIRKDGKLYVYTAGHVSGDANKECRLMLKDGRTISGKTLGANNEIDSGLIEVTETKIDTSGLPSAEVGDSESLKKGQWVVSIGHPGGFVKERTPVVRVGRILERNKKVLRTDCTLVGGDSGGPLFDLEGRVVGIHSRIGPTLNMNFHVPVDTFDETWDRLEKAEVWGGAKSILNLFGGGGGNAFMGIQTEVRDGKIVVEVVVKDSPAEKAGVKKGDVLVKLGSTALSGGDDIPAQLKKKKVGDKVELEILRDGKTMKLEVTLGKRPE